MCSGSPCGRASDGTDLYCIRPTDQKTADITRRYSGTTGTVIAVNPVFEDDRLYYAVSRERQAMLLGFMPVTLTVRERLNATDLAFISDERPWWAFLVIETSSPAQGSRTIATSTPAPVPTPAPAPAQDTGFCANQSWNEKCYDSAYDLDKDCHMTKDAANSVCGYKVKYPLGDTSLPALIDYEGWLAVYPWDCNDQDPTVWKCEAIPVNVSCTAPNGKNIFVNSSATGLDSNGKTIIVSDYCAATPSGAQAAEGQYVVKQQCLSNGQNVGAVYYKCPDCYWCSGGKCITKPSTGCDASCANQSWNTKCYNSSYDLDHDCNMTKDAVAVTLCENIIVNKYGKSEFDIWLATYPWDCNDTNPLQCGFSPACVGVVCPSKCSGTTFMYDGKCNDQTGQCVYKSSVPDSPSCKG
jgi:hypothetical protein